MIVSYNGSNEEKKKKNKVVTYNGKDVSYNGSDNKSTSGLLDAVKTTSGSTAKAPTATSANKTEAVKSASDNLSNLERASIIGNIDTYDESDILKNRIKELERYKADNDVALSYDASNDRLKKQSAIYQSEIDKLQQAVYGNEVYDNTFVDRFGANYTQGRLSQDSNKAWSEYIENPTPENYAHAQSIDRMLEQFTLNNNEALSEDGWISKSLAGYLPQAIDQTKARIGGAFIGGLGGSVIPFVGTGLGIKAGMVAASGKESYDNMRGSAYKSLIEAGVDNQTALAASQDEAVISSIIEMADTGIDIATFGIGKLIGNVGKIGLQQTAKAIASEGTEVATKKSLKKLLTALGKYGFNVGQEALEEASQEVISIANLRRALEGETGRANLVGNAVDTAFNLGTEDAQQVKQSAIEGARIAAMLGGATMLSTGMANTAIEARNNKIYTEVGQKIVEKDIVNDVIQTGLESAPETESHKLAQELQAKIEEGETVDEVEIGELYIENAKAIEDEEKASLKASYLGQNEDVSADDKLTAETPNAAEIGTQEATQPINNVVLTNEDRMKLESQRRRNEIGFTNAIRTLGDSGAKALGSTYKPTDNFDRFYKDFSTYYEAGSIGTPMDIIDANYSRKVAPDLKFAAYSAGQNDAKVSLERDKANQTVFYANGNVVDNEYSRSLPKSELRFYDMFSSITGNKVEFVGNDSIVAWEDKDGNKQYADGSYLNGYINVEIGTRKRRKKVILHEFDHGFERTSPEQFRDFCNYAVDIMEKSNGKTISVIEQYKRRYGGISTDKAMKEIAADFTDRLFDSDRELRKFIEDNIKDVKGRTMLEKFFDAVQDVIDKIKKAFGKDNKSDDFKMTVDELTQARQLWLDMLQATHENVKNAQQNKASEVAKNGGNIYDVRYSLNPNFAEQFDKWMELPESEKKKGRFLIGTTSEALKSVGVRDYKIYWDKSSLMAKMNKHSELTPETVKQLPNVIENPVLILQSSTVDNSITVWGEVYADDGKPIMVSIKLDPNAKTGAISDYAVITSAYKRPITQLQNFLDDINNILYLDENKKRTDTWLQSLGLQLPPLVHHYGSLRQVTFTNANVSKKSKTQNTGNVKRYSLKDSNGNQLTEEQAEFFKDSKVRDENGSLKVVYHGTRKAGFTVFNRTYNYYSDNSNVADSYSPNGEKYKGYLNITKPFIIDAEGERWSKIAVDYDVKEMLETYGSSTYKEDGKWRTSVADIVSAIYDGVEEGEFDYDGVIVLNVDDTGDYYKEETNIGNDYITFNSNQFKNVDNLNPTDDPDIRFQLKEPVEEKGTLVALHNLSKDKLTKALQLGGFPMPSIAVTKKDIPHTNFGDITLVMNKSTIDPKANKKNTVYSADAWTPVFPEIEYEADSKVQSRISKKYYDLAGKLGYDAVRPLYNYVNDVERELQRNGGEKGIIDSLKDSTDMMNVFLADSGKEQIKPISKEVVTRLDEDKIEQYEYLINGLGKDVVLALSSKNGENPMTVRKAWVAEHGETLENVYRGYLKDVGGMSDEEIENVMDSPSFSAARLSREVIGARNYINNGAETTRTEYDSTATKEAILKATDKKAYEKWLTDLFTGLTKSTGIYNNKEIFTPSGNRRSFSQTHYPVTLENIVKAMAGQNDGNTKNVSGFVGIKSLRAGTAERFKSIADMHAREGRLQHLTEEQAEAVNDALSERLSEIIRKVIKTKHGDKYENDFMMMDSVGNILVEVADNGKYTIDSIEKVFSKYQYKVGNKLAADIRDLLFDTSQMPVNIFEAKPERAVGFDEVLAAIVPDTMDTAFVEQLQQAGLNVLTYEEDNVESRLEAVNSVEGASFSLKDTGDILKENAQLKEYNEYLKSQMRLTKEIKVDQKELKRLVNSLAKEYGTTMPKDELFNRLNDLYTFMWNGKDFTFDDLRDKAIGIARDVVSEATAIDDDMYKRYVEIRDFIRKTRLTLSEEDRGSIAGGYNNFRKANMGRLNLANEGISVDRFYQQLSELYPDIFDAEVHTNPADQLENIVEKLNRLRNAYEYNPYDADTQSAIEWMANDIIDRYFELSQAKTYADKQKAKVKEKELATIMHEGAVAAREARFAEERLEALRKEKDNKIKEIRKNRDKKIENLKEAQKKRVAKMSDKRKRKILRDRIARHTKDLSTKLLKGSDKSHVPHDLRMVVVAVIDAINLESSYSYDPKTGKLKKNTKGEPTKRTNAFRELKEQYEAIKDKEYEVSMVIDPALLGDTENGSMLDAVIKMKDTRISDMTLEELETVWRVIRAVEKSITTAGKTLSDAKYATTKGWAEAFKNDTSDRKERKSNPLKDVSIDLETPYTFFAHFGQAGKDFFRMLRNAQDKQQILQDELKEKVRKVVSSEKREALEKDIVEYTTEKGDKLILSKAHLMEIYLLSKRKQARGHLLGKGIRQPEIKRKVDRGTKNTILLEEDLKKLEAKLSSEEKKIADDLQKITLFLAEKGNEASMLVFGYEKFNDPNYWTIKSAKEGVKKDGGKVQNEARSIKNMSSAMGLTEGATNVLEIGGIFNTFDVHASDMITYSVWLAPMEDANRLINFAFKDENGESTNAVMTDILNAYAGKNAEQYWLNLMKDIQNGISAIPDDNISSLIGREIGKVKGASVASNIRVVVQQPTSFIRAGVVLSPDNMLRGMAKGVNKGNGWEKAKKYAPIARMKEVGGFEVSNSPTQLSEVLYEPETKKGKVLQGIKELPTMGASKADEITWGAIWNACEWQVHKSNESLDVGSDEFNKAVAELFTEVIDQTQVVDGVLQRSQTMRSSNWLNKQASSFMGEPTLSLNLLMRSYDNWKSQTNPKKRTEARKKMGQAIFTLMLSNFVVAVAQSSVDGLRDDDEEKKYLERFLSALTGVQGDEEGLSEIGKNMLLDGNIGESMNVAAWIPYVKDFFSIVQGYDVERLDASAISDFVSAANNSIKSLSGEGKWSKGYALGKMFMTGAKLFGSSASNVVRDIESIVRSVFIETENWKGLYGMEKQRYNTNTQKSKFLDILYQSYKSEDRDTYDYIVKDLVDEGVAPSDIESGMRSRWKKDAETVKDFDDVGEFEFGAGIEFKYDVENDDDDKYTIDNLNSDQYIEYSYYNSGILSDIMKDFERLGFDDIDEETANSLLSSAYSYAEKVALEEASDGEYQVDTKWMQEVMGGALGLSPAEYIFYKEEYSSSTLSSKGIQTAYEAGVEPSVYLEAKDKIDDIKDKYDTTAKRKKEVTEYLESLNLTDKEFKILWETAGGYKS